MSDKLRAAAQAALLALDSDHPDIQLRAAMNLRAALAEPAQEPMHPEIKKMYEDYFDKCYRESSAQQRPWVGLTDDEIWQEWSSPKDSAIDFARAIEDKLRRKNT